MRVLCEHVFFQYDAGVSLGKVVPSVTATCLKS
jgi:hypothetical protein